jgi:transcriptional regulator with XRE-family HTH domain
MVLKPLKGLTRLSILGDRIKSTRQKKDITQDEMAEMIGVTRGGYSSYETGKNVPPADKLSKIADILKVSADYLLGRTDDPYQLISLDNGTLSEEEQGMLKKFLIESEEIIRSKGSADEEKLNSVMRFMKFIFLEDLAKEKKNNKS